MSVLCTRFRTESLPHAQPPLLIPPENNLSVTVIRESECWIRYFSTLNKILAEQLKARIEARLGPACWISQRRQTLRLFMTFLLQRLCRSVHVVTVARGTQISGNALNAPLQKWLKQLS